jgi:hypothetical protein
MAKRSREQGLHRKSAMGEAAVAGHGEAEEVAGAAQEVGDGGEQQSPIMTTMKRRGRRGCTRSRR